MFISSFSKNFQVFFTGKFLLALATVVVGIVTARSLSLADRGLYALFFSYVGFGTIIFHFGISPSIVFFLNKQDVLLESMFGNVTMLVSLISVLAVCVLALSASIDSTQSPLHAVPVEYIALGGIAVVATLIEVSFTGFALARSEYRLLNAVAINQALVLLVSAWALICWNVSLLTLVVFRVSGFALICLFFLLVLRRKIAVKKISFSKCLLKEQLAFGVMNWLQNLIGFINLRSYVILLGLLSGAETAALFSIAWLIVELIRFVPDILATMTLPKLTEAKGLQQRRSFTWKMLGFVTLLVAVGCYIVYLLSPLVIPLVFGEEYVAIVPVMHIILVGAMAGTLYQILTRYFTSIARQLFSIVSVTCGALLGILVSIWLIPVSGLYGAAVAYCSASIVCGLLSLLFFLMPIPEGSIILSDK